MIGRDHRDDGQPMECLVWGLPLAAFLWVVAIGVGGLITAAVTA